MSAVRCPIALKTVRFSILDCENTFKYVCLLAHKPLDTTKIEKVFVKRTTLNGYCIDNTCKFPPNFPKNKH